MRVHLGNGIAAVIAVAALAGWGVGHAAAAPVTIAEGGQGAGRVLSPGGVAVDHGSGDLYVADGNNFRIDKFDDEGNFLLAWGYGVRDGRTLALQTCGPEAVPPTTRCFRGEGVNLVKGADVVVPRGIAVDSASGNVYVADTNSARVSVFGPSGEFLRAFGGDAVAEGPGNTGADEQQKATVTASGGKFSLTAITAQGFGRTSEGSTLVTQVSNTLGAFHVGDRINGQGIPFNQTTVIAVDSNTVTLSRPAAASGASRLEAVENTGATGVGLRTSGSTELTEVKTRSGAFEVGERISGTGIPAGTTITAVGGETLTLSAAATSGSGASTTLTASDIPYNAGEGEVEAALEALPGIGAGNVGVARTEASATEFEYAVTFSGGPLSGNDIGQMMSTPADLEGAGKAAAISTASQGGGPEVCVASAGDVCKEASTGSEAGQFGLGAPGGMSFDASGSLWVGDLNRTQQFEPSGTFVSQAPLAGGGLIAGLAIDPSSGDFYVKDSLAGVRRYEPTGSPVDMLTEAATGTPLDAAGAPRAVTVDGSGTVFIGDATSPYRFEVYDASGEQVSQFGAGQVIGAPGGADGRNALALDEGVGTLYAASSSGAESAVQAFALPESGPLPENQRAEGLEEEPTTTITLAANLNPEGAETEYFFEYGTSESYGGETATETLGVEEFDPETVEAAVEGLTPSTTYHFHLVARSECEPVSNPGHICVVEGPDTTFTTLPAISVDAQWASEVAAHSAALHGELNPLGVGGRWWIEYGPSACPSSGCAKTAELELPAGFGDVSVGAVLTGLEPATTYHYRFVARDERDGVEYEAAGPDRAFTTQLGALGFSLADNRAWEMVSPPQKFGALLVPAQSGQIQASADGDGLAYLSLGSIEAASEGARLLEESYALAHRNGAGAWSSTDITPPNTDVVELAIGQGGEFKLFSSDLSSAVLEPRSNTLLSPEASERTPYLRRNNSVASYRPLVTSREGFANVPAGTEFGTDPSTPPYPFGAVRIKGASPGLDHVVLQSKVPLVEGGGAVNGLYEWTDGRLSAISVKPEGGAPVEATLGSGAASVRHAISNDGSRVFWSSGGSALTGLYLRDLAAEETIRIDLVRPGGYGTGAVEPAFQGANPEGTVAFFTDTQQLTEDSNENGADLYRWQAEGSGSCEEPGGCLSDVTSHTENLGESAEVQGLAAGMSDDGTMVYFVARGALAANPVENGEGLETASPGAPNLYLWQQGVGTRYIARLSEVDFHDWGVAAVVPEESCCFAGQRSSAPSPSGRYLALMSERSLTGYDNRDAATGEPDQEVFRYDATTGELRCVSCNPSGTRPAGLQGEKAGGLRAAFDPQDLWAETNITAARALAATLPEATTIGVGESSLYRPRAVGDNGRVFFNAADSLVGADSNGNWDVYEYEPAGVGSCTASTDGTAIARSGGGCVALISSGAAEEEAAFLDASEGGNDVFFFTPAQLSVLDEDKVRDIYDARVDGVTATRTARAECLGEACQPAVLAPGAQTPASSAFHGPGNLSEGPTPSCRAVGRRAVRLSRRAKRLRRRVRMTMRNGNGTLAHKRARKARRLAKRAHRQSRGARRCRRVKRRVGR